MTQYQLPRTKSGEVDWRMVQHHLSSAWGFETFNFETFDAVIKAIDANARAEEREACAAIADEWAQGIAEGREFSALGVAEEIGFDIRDRGDSQ